MADALSLTKYLHRTYPGRRNKGRKFDIAISRAVAPLKDLWVWARPLLNHKTYIPPGKFRNPPNASGLICLKGGDLAAEISESGTRPKFLIFMICFPKNPSGKNIFFRFLTNAMCKGPSFFSKESVIILIPLIKSAIFLREMVNQFMVWL